MSLLVLAVGNWQGVGCGDTGRPCSPSCVFRHMQRYMCSLLHRHPQFHSPGTEAIALGQQVWGMEGGILSPLQGCQLSLEPQLQECCPSDLRILWAGNGLREPQGLGMECPHMGFKSQFSLGSGMRRECDQKRKWARDGKQVPLTQ